MRRYEFHSSLTPEQVFAKLDVYARPWDMTAFGDETFRSKRKKDRFYLGYTGTLPASGCVPFSGQVRAEDGGSVISGSFNARAIWYLMGPVFLFVCLMMMALEVPPPVAIIVPLLWAALFAAFYTGIQTVFFKKRQQAVLEFIQHNLLE